MKKILLLASVLAISVASLNAQTITQWTFEGETLTPSTGTGTATLGTGGTQSFPAGFGSTDAWSSNGWAPGEFFQFEVSTIGYTNIGVSWDQVGSSTGPVNFTLQYSTDGVVFTDFTSYTVNLSTWNTTVTPAADVYTFNLSSITALNNDASVYFRLTAVDTVSIGGGVVGAAGTSRVDNFTVVSIPEPATGAMLVGGLGSMFWVARRRRLIA